MEGVIICICFGQLWLETFREQFYQTPVSKWFLASVIVLGLGVWRWEWSLGKQCMNILQSLFHLFIPVLTLNKNISGLTILRWLVGPIHQLGAMPIYMCSLQIPCSNSWLGGRYGEVGLATIYYRYCLQPFLWKNHERDQENIAMGTFDIPNYISG